jgi:hypothetical protein
MLYRQLLQSQPQLCESFLEALGLDQMSLLQWRLMRHHVLREVRLLNRYLGIHL